MKLTCHNNEIHAMLWTAEPYIPANDPIIYVSGQIAPGSYPVYQRGSFVVILTNLTRSYGDIHRADMGSELSFNTNEVENGTRIMCKTYRGSQPSQIWSTFYHAGMKVGCSALN